MMSTVFNVILIPDSTPGLTRSTLTSVSAVSAGSELMSGMKVYRGGDAPPAPGRAQRVRQQVGERRADTLRQTRRDRPARAASAALPQLESVDLNEGPGLDIFTKMKTDGAGEDCDLIHSLPFV